MKSQTRMGVTGKDEVDIKKGKGNIFYSQSNRKW